MKLYTFPQKSQDWWRVRCGVPTASQFHRVLTPAQEKPSTAQAKYIDQLVLERIQQSWSIEPEKSFVSDDMQHGIDHEPAAREWYRAFGPPEETAEVGFCLSDCGRFGCSPDGLVGEDGALEIKCPAIQTQIRYLRIGGLPPKYKCQVHGTLIVTRRKWVDFVSFGVEENVKTFMVRVYPDAFTEMLEKELDRFHLRYLAAWAKMGCSLDRPIDKMVPSLDLPVSKMVPSFTE